MAPSERPESAGERLYLIRLACGDGVRTPETLERFADRVQRHTRTSYSSMTLSLLERMKQKWRIEDAEILARVDPRNRGAVWLSALEQTLEQPPEQSVEWPDAPGGLRVAESTPTPPPAWRGVAEKHGGEIEEGLTERPTKRPATTKKAANAKKRR